jgi:glucosamine kinase
MIAIIDSGSTKADWVVTDGKEHIILSTAGMNPNFINGEEVKRIVSEGILSKISPVDISNIHYFGTGCSSALQKKIISDALESLFPKADVLVDHDIHGAVLATCGNDEGIACIIGTGSNSVYFDGIKIHENNYGLGYILADEGAGTWLGKKIVTHYFYHLLPEKLSQAFTVKYHLTRDDVINNVYGNPTANSWLAGFVVFLNENRNDEWVKNIIKEGFGEFIKLFVMNYPRYNELPVHFVGSVAFLFQDYLEEVAIEKNIRLGKIIQKPIEGLRDYYIKEYYR